MDGLKPSQKAKLQEVANLMLEIYRTLVRMQYLDPLWIREGPHNIDALLPIYNSHGLDASVIYLYSILPYIDTARVASVDFFKGGRFADFRRERDVADGRDPLHDSQEGAIRPWMTPLSLLGNHGTVIIYDARKHCVGMFDHESCGSTDRNLHAPREVDMQDMSEDEDEDEDGDEDEDEDEEDSEDAECHYDEMDSRPAGDVLRDIVHWYHELIEMPGLGGDNSWGEWDPEIIKPLYRKHGWPSSNFDGDAFLVDQARAAAASRAKDLSEEPIQEVAKFKGWLEAEDSPAMQRRRDTLAAATTDDEQWLARWELWQAEYRNRRNLKNLRRAEETRKLACPDGQCQKPEELPLWEERQLRENSWQMQRALQKIQQEAKKIQAGEREAVPGMELKLRHAEKEAAVYQKAHEASRLAAERLCPGKSFTVGLGVESSGLDLEKRMEELTRYLEETEWEVKLIREWMTQLPDDASQARQAIRNVVDQSERYIKAYTEQRRGVTLGLEKLGVKTP